MSRQRLSPSLGESAITSARAAPVPVPFVTTNRVALYSASDRRRSAEREHPGSHAIVPVPIASYLLNEKRSAEMRLKLVRTAYAV